MFVRKVFSLLACMLLVTTGIAAIFVYSEGVAHYAQQNLWLVLTAIGVYLVTAIMLTCCTNLRRQHPTNIILLGIFTLATSIMIGVVCTTYTVESVVYAAGITTVCCTAVAVFALTTKIDFTECAGILYCLLFVFVLSGLFIAIPFRTDIMYRVYAGIGAAVFMVILIVDLQLIMGGKRMAITPEEYVYATLQIYLDIINIFLKILQIVGERK